MINNNITSTETGKDDLNPFFQFQLDKEANYLAAFTSKDPNDKTAYIEKYTKFLADPSINMRTIKVNDEIAGSIAKFVMENDAGITYGLTENLGTGNCHNRTQRLFEDRTSPAHLWTCYI